MSIKKEHISVNFYQCRFVQDVVMFECLKYTITKNYLGLGSDRNPTQSSSIIATTLSILMPMQPMTLNVSCNPRGHQRCLGSYLFKYVYHYIGVYCILTIYVPACA